MWQKFVSALTSFFFLFIFVLPQKVFAITKLEAGKEVVPGCKIIEGDVPSLGCLSQVIMNAIEMLFFFLGTVALLFIFYAAIRFIVARGDPKAIQTAQKTLTYAIIGTILAATAYATISIFTGTFGITNILQQFGIYQQSP